MFSAAAATRLASKKGSSSLLSSSTSLFQSFPLKTTKLAALSARSQSRNLFSRPDPELIRSALQPLKTHWKSIVAGLAVGTGIAQTLYGNEDNFYDKRFILECDPDDIADFYGSENFMVRTIVHCILRLTWT